MINIKCNYEYFDSVIAFAKSIDKYDQLCDHLDYLHSYGDSRGWSRDWVCELYSDFVITGEQPTNFLFTIKKRVEKEDWETYLQGGLIFYNPTQEWSVHT